MLWKLIILLLLVVLVGRAIWRLVGGIVDGAASWTGRVDQQPDARMVKDPVCGTYVVPSRALTASRGAETAWFCSPECQRTWQQRSARASRG